MAGQTDPSQSIFGMKISPLIFFSIVITIISGSILSALVYEATHRFRSRDVIPELISLTPDVKKALGDNPGVAQVGLYIKDFAEFDLLANRFEFSAILWFLFDPSIISLETLGKFSFQKGEILFKSEPNNRIVRGKLLARYDIRVRFKTNVSYFLFPFDSHTVYISLDNNYVTPGEVIFESTYDNFMLSPEIEPAGWKVHGTRVYTGYSVAPLEKQQRANDVSHPRIIFAIDFLHAGVRQALTILLPLIFIFFMSIFSFTLGTDNYRAALALSSGTATALLAYRFVIENLSPKVGYLMLSDYVFFLIFGAVFIVFFATIGLRELSEKYKTIFILLLHAIVVLSLLYLLRF